MRIIIIANGVIMDYNRVNELIGADVRVICCDGGAGHCRAMGLVPGVIIGDFDSANGEDIRYFEGLGAEIVKYPPEKDYTDFELCVLRAIEERPERVQIFGATGGRADHFLANIAQLKAFCDARIPAEIIDEQNRISLISDSARLDVPDGAYVSLIPYSEEVRGVVTKGLRYPLHGETLYRSRARGVSNRAAQDSGSAEISVGEGLLYIIISDE